MNRFARTAASLGERDISKKILDMLKPLSVQPP